MAPEQAATALVVFDRCFMSWWCGLGGVSTEERHCALFWLCKGKKVEVLRAMYNLKRPRIESTMKINSERKVHAAHL